MKTFKEQGVDIAFTKFYFYSFPKGTPKEIVEKFTKAIEKVVTSNPDYAKETEKFMVSIITWHPDEA